MTEFAKMDLFFAITTAAVVILTAVLAVVLIYIVKILRDVKYISKKAKNEADILTEELSELRQNVKEKGAKLKHLFSFFNNVYKKSKKN